jgi:hypothetical protein
VLRHPQPQARAGARDEGRRQRPLDPRQFAQIPVIREGIQLPRARRVAPAVAREMDLAHVLRGDAVEISETIETVIRGADVHVVHVQQQAAACAS